jgi:DNA topoisomerase-1
MTKTSANLRAAKSAGLRYVSDAMPGFRRIGTKKVFRYLDTQGHVIKSPGTLQRIQRLAIPPAWTNVWICPTAEGHLQAVGRDARGRKQYRYHPHWRETRDETKYDRMAAFGNALPKIRRRVARDLREKQLTRNKVLATVVRLLETTFLRVGNKEYADQNGSFGLTTLRDRHVGVKGSQTSFYFRGKSGVKQSVDIRSASLAKIVRRLQDLPGYELFQYYDDDGELRKLESADVNAYLREASGDDFTAKDFRTWAGTMLAAEALKGGEFSDSRQAQQNVMDAIASVASQLGNTAAVCRKCYIHPAILDGYVDGSFASRFKAVSAHGGLTAHEASVVSFLRRYKPKASVSLEHSLKQSVRHIRKLAHT